MRLLYITNGIHGAGGLERVLAIKSNYLIQKMNYEIAIVTLNSPTKDFFYSFNSNIQFYNVNVNGGVLSYYKLYKTGVKNIIKKFNPDIISVCDDGLKGLLFPFLIKVKKPLVYERHASLQFNFIKENISFSQRVKTNLLRILMRFGAKGFDEFVVLTSGNISDWPKVRCKVIPNPSPFDVCDDFDIKKEKVVLAVGTQSYNKGYDRLIKVWSSIAKTHPDWKLKIYGKPKESLKLNELVKSLNLSNKIFLFKPIKNIDEEYKKASIFALSSRTEGFGMVLIEAMSFGVPCVAFDCPHGPRDIINNEEDGFLVTNGNLEEFEKKLVCLMDDDEKRRLMSIKSKENIKKFSLPEIMGEWNKLFKDLMK